MSTPTLEICAGSWDSVLAARSGGAARVELCSGLTEGGLTPSVGFIRAACALGDVRVHVLIRPRGGDFLYTEAEVALMEDDICRAVEAGADGVVVGSLTPDGDIDTRQLRRWVRAAGGRDVTFHRAFDLCRCPEEALEAIIDSGCSRLLTSGQAATAEAGIPQLRRLVEQSAGRLSVMPGCGVGAGNAARILAATGAREIHASARRPVGSLMKFRHSGVSMGAPTDEYTRLETSADEVRAILASFGGLAQSAGV